MRNLLIADGSVIYHLAVVQLTTLGHSWSHGGGGGGGGGGDNGVGVGGNKVDHMVTGYTDNNLQQFWKTCGPFLGGSVLHQPILWRDQWRDHFGQVATGNMALSLTWKLFSDLLAFLSWSFHVKKTAWLEDSTVATGSSTMWFLRTLWQLVSSRDRDLTPPRSPSQCQLEIWKQYQHDWLAIVPNYNTIVTIDDHSPSYKGHHW